MSCRPRPGPCSSGHSGSVLTSEGRPCSVRQHPEGQDCPPEPPCPRQQHGAAQSEAVQVKRLQSPRHTAEGMWWPRRAPGTVAEKRPEIGARLQAWASGSSWEHVVGKVTRRREQRGGTPASGRQQRPASSGQWMHPGAAWPGPGASMHVTVTPPMDRGQVSPCCLIFCGCCQYIQI